MMRFTYPCLRLPSFELLPPAALRANKNLEVSCFNSEPPKGRSEMMVPSQLERGTRKVLKFSFFVGGGISTRNSKHRVVS